LFPPFVLILMICGLLSLGNALLLICHERCGFLFSSLPLLLIDSMHLKLQDKYRNILY
jgi:hypothetical protein